MNDVGKFIKDIRIKNNLTQAQLAEKLNVTYQAISKWENGKSLPDIETIKRICNMFNVNFDNNIINKPKKYRYLIIIFLVLFLIVSIYLLISKSNNHSIELKPLSTTCTEFKITGSAAYSKDKTSILISDISYCGEEDNTIYKEIDCILFEENNGDDVIINNCKSKENISLNAYLNNIVINVENYNRVCKNVKDTKLYLEINAKTKGSKTIKYNIPLKIDNGC